MRDIVEWPRKPRARERLFEELSRIVDKLSEEASEGVPILVEGKRDAEALHRLGVFGEIMILRSVKGLREIFEERAMKKIILLFDLDSEGERLTKNVAKILEGLIREVDVSYRKRLMRFRALGLVEIESLDGLMERMKAF